MTRSTIDRMMHRLHRPPEEEGGDWQLVPVRTNSNDHRLAQLAAIALALSVVEAAIPSPLPGVKPGLANIVTLLVLYRYGLRDAVWVSLLRVVVGSLLAGSFLAPAFALSFSGASASLLALALAQHLPRRHFGPVTLSIVAAFAHMAGQLAVAYLWLIPHSGIAYLVPIFFAAAFVFGAANGLIAARLLRPQTIPSQATLEALSKS